MAITDLQIPDFLLEDEDTIHERMLEKAPDNISTIPGEFFYDATRPTAEEITEMKINLQEIFKIMNPYTSHGIYLEFLGEQRCVFKNQATKAVGQIIVTGKEGTVIPIGTEFATPSDDTIQSIYFVTTEEKTIDSIGTVNIHAECTQPGTLGNVQANTVTIITNSITGVEGVSNTKFANGTDIEDEEHFRQRVIESEKIENLSGSDTDYERWAKEVDGVGDVKVKENWNGPGTVKLLIVDKENKRASDELIAKVKDYIYPDKLPGENRKGKAPTGAVVTISTPNSLDISIKANFHISPGFNQVDVFNLIKTRVNTYLAKIDMNSKVRYDYIEVIVGNIMVNGEGLDDFENLTINDATEDITLNDEIPNVHEVIGL